MNGGWRFAGTYQQIGVDLTFASMLKQAADQAAARLRAGATRMAKDAALVAATLGLGVGIRAGIEATMAARAPTAFFKIGAANMAALSSAGIDASTAKEAARLLIQSRLGTVPAVATKIEGFVEINGRVLKVTAGVNAAGETSVGAIRVVR